MALTDNQKGLMRLMITHSGNVTEDQLATWAAMSDDDITAVINTWVTAKKASPNSTQGIVAKITALGG